MNFIKRFGLTLTLLSALGCSVAKVSSPTVSPDHRDPVVKHVAPPPASVMHLSSKTGWTLTLPNEWAIKVSPDAPRSETPDDDTHRELLAASKTAYGNSPVVITVLDVDWSEADGTPEDFVQGIVAILFTEDVEVKAIQPISFSGKPATAAMYVTPTDLVVIQLAVGTPSRGFVLSCGGDANAFKQVGTICKEVMTTFDVK